MSDLQVDEVEIRPWSEGDLGLLERLMGDPAMMVHLGGPESPEKIRNRHERYCKLNGTGDGQMYVITIGSDGIAAGSVGYWEHEWQGEQAWETGWSVLPEYQGRGLAALATTRMVERASAAGKHRYLFAYPGVENGSSNAICRKLGFTLLEEAEFEYPQGNVMRCNVWRLDLHSSPDGS